MSVLFRGGRRETELLWVGVTAGPGETEGVADMFGSSCTVVILAGSSDGPERVCRCLAVV